MTRKMKREVLFVSSQKLTKGSKHATLATACSSGGSVPNDLNKEGAEKNTDMVAHLSARRAIGVMIVGGNRMQSTDGLYTKDIGLDKCADYFKCFGMN